MLLLRLQKSCLFSSVMLKDTGKFRITLCILSALMHSQTYFWIQHPCREADMTQFCPRKAREEKSSGLTENTALHVSLIQTDFNWSKALSETFLKPWRCDLKEISTNLIHEYSTTLGPWKLQYYARKCCTWALAMNKVSKLLKLKFLVCFLWSWFEAGIIQHKPNLRPHVVFCLSVTFSPSFSFLDTKKKKTSSRQI